MMFVPVFDVVQEGYLHNMYFLFIPLAFILFSAMLIFAPNAMQAIFPYGPRGRVHHVLSRFMFAVSIIVTIVFAFMTLLDNWNSISQIQSGRYLVVEGPVMDYVPPGENGHGTESFTVGGQRFTYTVGDLVSGFHTTKAQGGPIQPGQYVRISYAAGVILRLELAKGNTVHLGD